MSYKDVGHFLMKDNSRLVWNENCRLIRTTNSFFPMTKRVVKFGESQTIDIFNGVHWEFIILGKFAVYFYGFLFIRNGCIEDRPKSLLSDL